MDDLPSILRQDADMLCDGHQKNLTKLWHSDVVKEAAVNAVKAAEAIERYREDAAFDQSVNKYLRSEVDRLTKALDIDPEAVWLAYCKATLAGDRSLKDAIEFACRAVRLAAHPQ